MSPSDTPVRLPQTTLVRVLSWWRVAGWSLIAFGAASALSDLEGFLTGPRPAWSDVTLTVAICATGALQIRTARMYASRAGAASTAVVTGQVLALVQGLREQGGRLRIGVNTAGGLTTIHVFDLDLDRREPAGLDGVLALVDERERIQCVLRPQPLELPDGQLSPVRGPLTVRSVPDAATAITMLVECYPQLADAP